MRRALVVDPLVLQERVSLVPVVRGAVGPADDIRVHLQALLEVPAAALPVAEQEVEREAVAAGGPVGGVAHPAGILERRVELEREGVEDVGSERAGGVLCKLFRHAQRGAAAAGLRVADGTESGDGADLLRAELARGVWLEVRARQLGVIFSSH